MLNSIEKEWQSFSEMVFKGTPASEVQRREMKKAFFAGYWSLFAALEEIGEPHVSEAEGEAFLDARQDECREFLRRLIAEYAEGN